MAEALARHVEGLGLAVYGQTAHVGFQPADPDDLVTFEDETAPLFEAGDGLANDNLGVQVTVRARAYEDARAKAFAIHRAIVGFSGLLYAGFPRVVTIGVVTPPASTGRDEKERIEFAAHYELLIESEGDTWRR